MDNISYMVFCPKCARIHWNVNAIGSICNECKRGILQSSKLVTTEEYKTAFEHYCSLDKYSIYTQNTKTKTGSKVKLYTHLMYRLEQKIFEKEIIPLGELETWTYAYKLNYYMIYGGRDGGVDPSTGTKLVEPVDPALLPKCPICGSTNLKKISAANKIGSVALFGLLAAGHVSKTWKCENCGSKF